MKKTAFLAVILLVASSWGFAATSSRNDHVVKIEVSRDYDGYSVQDLKRRIWQLELAVEQLQRKVFSSDELNRQDPAKTKMHTCYITTFGKTYSETRPTLTEAKAALLKTCSEAHHAVQCPESDMKCGQ